ncbi:cytochrome P450 [Panus rudis PR-1116 ss-1]|nr:cytochrome P450 [Panus rudis PR-1116 ss-1]
MFKFVTSDISVISSVIVALFFIHHRRSLAKRSKYPPGPPGYPLVGNVDDIPPHKAWYTFLEWSRQYGSDIIGLRTFGTNIVVINSLEAATDLLHKRSSIYSDRPHLTMLYDLVGFDWTLAFTRYGDHWRDMRRAFHQEFNQAAVEKYRELQVKACHELLRKYASHPETFMEDIRHLAGRVIIGSAYGIEIKGKGNRYIEVGEVSLHALSAASNAGSYMVDTLPFLKYLPEWFPGAGFRREAKAWAPYVSAMLHEPYTYLKQQMEESCSNQCAGTSLLDGMVTEAQDPVYMEHIVQRTLGSMYTGGTDTTVSALSFFMLAMVLYPEVQQKARKELDMVLGTGALPDFRDRPSLPYIEAIVTETLRWHPVVPLDVPHRLIADDTYKEYFLPEGTIVVANSWAMLHNETIYPDPHTFNPDRFMKDGQLDPDVRDPAVAAFGFGRRICPGQALASDTMWIVIASILASFDISPAEDRNGEKIIPAEDFYCNTFFVPSYMKPFRCQILPRSEEWRGIIDATAVNDVMV